MPGNTEDSLLVFLLPQWLPFWNASEALPGELFWGEHLASGEQLRRLSGHCRGSSGLLLGAGEAGVTPGHAIL